MALAEAAPAAFQQVGILGGVGSVIGATVASKVGPTELPQTVAAFHSLGKCLDVYVCSNQRRMYYLTICTNTPNSSLFSGYRRHGWSCWRVSRQCRRS